MADLPGTMKAWMITRVGKMREVLELKTDWPTASLPKAGEVMIRVAYAALNPGDLKLMETWMPFRLPANPGMDFVGEIVQVSDAGDSSVGTLRIGTVVAGAIPLSLILRGRGTLAEFIVVPSHAIVQKPDSLEETIAAGLFGIAGQTAAKLIRTSGVRKGDKVLLNGASGGVGLILTQALSGIGAHVTGICSAKNEALVRTVGVEDVVDYKAHKDLCLHLSNMCTTANHDPYDLIFDCVGNKELCDRSHNYLKSSGQFLTIEGTLLTELKANYFPTMLGGTPRTYHSVFALPSGSLAADVVGWVDQGWIKEVPVDAVFGMDDAVKAYEKQATGRATGKIVVKVP